MLRALRQNWAWAAVAVTAAANLAITFGWHSSPQEHGLTDTLTICLVVVAAVRQFGGPRIKPGQMIVSVADFQRAEQIQKASIAEGHGDACIFQERRNARSGIPAQSF